MIVFVDDKTLRKNRILYPDAVCVGITGEMRDSWLAEGAYLLPPTDVLARYVDTGDKDVFREDYWRYLSDPRVRYMLLLQVYRATSELMFFVCTEDEKELRYPKALKDYIIDALGIDAEYVISFKKFKKNKKMSKEATKAIQTMMLGARAKAREALD